MKFWKLKRELRRSAEQLFGLLASLWEPWAQRRHDRMRPWLVQRWIGSIRPNTLKPRVAVYLLYQPSALSESAFLACEYLVSKGFAPLVVSNASLNLNDLERLRSVAWQVVQRPNYGYDFGGYREGILQLQDLHCDPYELILVNDSVWFPFPLSADPIDQIRRETGSMVGLLSAEGKRSHTLSDTARPEFICSFFLYFTQDAIRHLAFKEFWGSYICSNSKFKTIRRGERGLSYAMKGAGIKLASVMNRAKFDRWLEELDAAELLVALDFVVTHEESCREKLKSLLSSPKKNTLWAQHARDFLKYATDGQNYPSLLPYLFVTQSGPGYFKKALDPYNRYAMQRVVREKNCDLGICGNEMSSRLLN